MSGATYFPLRWESTGDQWWYASPIDLAAANGHYDLVRELLRLDNNHLIKLTSLRRIRRLETVWDDGEGHTFHDVAKCRSRVARHLFHECRHPTPAKNSLIRAGYGGWLMYTAASAGDLAFVRDLLQRYPLLVFGEGEYGATDILYAAARSKSCEVFRVLLDFAMSPRFMGEGGEVEEQIGEEGSSLCVFKWEMMNRAVHAAARGGNLQILKQLLAGSSSSHVLAYRDAHGSTLLHAASSKGQVQVVRDLIGRFDMIESKDNEGNTALHIAAYKGQPVVVEALVAASPSLVSSTNNAGETFLHSTVSGFLSSAFRRLDRQTELMRQLVSSPHTAVAPVINAKNNDGRTALHTAIMGNIHSDLVELLMTAPAIDVNVRDSHGMTPLDLLKTRPRSASSEILIRQLISAGGVFGRHDYSTRRAMLSHLKMQGNGNSPGTRFGVSDTEIFLYTGINININTNTGQEYPEAEQRRHSSASVTTGQKQNKLASSVNQRLKRVLLWPMRAREGAAGAVLEEPPTPLRQRFSSSSRPSPLPGNKRPLSVRSNASSPLAKKKFASGIVQGVMQAMAVHNGHGHSKSLSKSSFSSSGSLEKQKGVMCVPREEAASCSKQVVGDDVPNLGGSLRRLRNQYLCFGSQGLTVKLPESHRRSCVATAY